MRCLTASQNQRSPNPTKGFLHHIKYEHLIAGVSGGVTSTIILHPLDLLKIRFAVNDGQLMTRPNYRGVGNAISTILREEGVRGLYRGVTPNCWGAGASWGFYFLFYNAIKTYTLESTQKETLTAGKHMLAAAEAGVLTLFITNPIWVVKTRMCLQYAAVGMPPSKHYSGMFDALTKVYRHEGVQGMYKGLVPGLFGVSHGALQFMAYEEMKKGYTSYYHLPLDEKMGNIQYLSFAALSKFFAASITYPYQVVRARLQDQHKEYTGGVVEVIRRTWRYEGIRGFYKGLPAYFLHVTPNICIVFLIYEKLTLPYAANIIAEKDIL